MFFLLQNIAFLEELKHLCRVISWSYKYEYDLELANLKSNITNARFLGYNDASPGELTHRVVKEGIDQTDKFEA